MKRETFNKVVDLQLNRCRSLLVSKGEEYAPDKAETHDMSIVEQDDGQLAFAFAVDDRLQAFKKAARIMNTTPKIALLGMLSKHLVSVTDMITDNQHYDLERWDEKITDSMNYLILLRALVEEEEAKHDRD